MVMRVSMMLCCIFICSSCLSQGSGTRIYVSGSTGNDQWDGTSMTHGVGNAGPLASLKQARELVKVLNNGKADTIYVNIAGGLYLTPQQFKPEDGGNGKTVIVYQADKPNDKPIFSGARLISAKVGGNDEIIKIALPDVKSGKFFFEQLYLNGDFLVRAREPNSGFASIDAIKEDTLEPPKTKGASTQMSLHRILNRSMVDDGTYSKLADLSQADLNNVLVTILYKWNVAKRYVDQLDPSRKTFITKGAGEGAILKWNVGTLFYLENSLAFLDTTNEWYLDKTAGMLYFYNGRKYKNTLLNFYAPGVETIFKVQGVDGNKIKNLAFRNLSFQYSGLFTPSDGVMGAQTTPWLSGAVLTEFSENISFTGCEFQNLANSGIWLKTAANNNNITDCYFHNLGLSAVKVGDFGAKPDNLIARNNTISNNIIQTGGLIFPSAPGIVLYFTAGNKVMHNDISDFKYSGISNGYTWGKVATPNSNNYFGYNEVHHIGGGIMDDLAGIYTLGQSFGTVIENNLVHDIYCHRFGANGIYLDQSSSGVTVRNNLVYNCQSAGLLFSIGEQNVITNNIFAENHLAQLFFATAVADGPPQMRFSNNIIFYSEGKLFTEHWDTSPFVADSNCYWAINDDHNRMFGGLSLESWRQQSGKDKHSVVANPGFINAEAYNFNLKSGNIAVAIGFKPFKTEEAGVTGAVAWKEKAKLSGAAITNFKQSVKSFSVIK